MKKDIVYREKIAYVNVEQNAYITMIRWHKEGNVTDANRTEGGVTDANVGFLNEIR